ncbi:tetratricopeptide repeat protein [Lentzea sp. NBC_00516]|uniref:AfsR/SARP family transcriptional regulator n=1 Tax=Lentzea sp. NBC_00516 TaxID=2903582 RepID=UPI002E817652|nr:BTAD domain-containing putative transcriptional regulator [Lentzea sp. NBC_00516]WUD23467.1 tetratricopeptide repeat protein [Lentzea sp. NBC_00516]
MDEQVKEPMNVEYRVLGPLEVLRDGVRVPVPAGRGRVLLATLLLRPNRFVSVDELVERLWDGEPPTLDRAHKTLQMVVRRLRMALGDANCVRTATGGYLAEVDPERLDLTRFRRLAAEGEFAAALAHWRGEVASNVASQHLHREDVPPLVEERLVVHGRRIEADLAHGRGAGLVDELWELTGEHPLREGFWAQLVQALHQAGRPVEALAAYEQIRDHLDDELGVEPGQPLRDLHARLLDPASRTGVPRQLPVGAVHFAGRDAELARLTEVTTGGAAVVITAIDGTAGIGKTALAVRWAHSVADRFPDGQLYVDLRGFDPSADPADPAEVLAAFLGAFGVSGGRVPVDLPERAALYRSVVADRRVLVLLDNARDVEQVRPLLPAGRGCLVVITSRNRFTGLVVREGAVPVTLDLLGEDDAVALLTARLGAGRVAAEPDAVADLVAFCGGLPLALAVAASRAADDPGLGLRALVDELRASDGLMTHVEAVFATSCSRLDDDTARLFRLLGLTTGPDISLDAATALDGRRRAEVRRSLQTLARMHLLDERSPGRYTSHDLLREYARSLREADPATERLAAVRRLLEFYLHSVDGADRLLRHSRVTITFGPLSDGVQPVLFEDSAVAAAWCETEHENLLAAVGLAGEHGLHQHAWQLATVMFGYLHLRGRPSERIALYRVALAAARASADRYAEGITLHSLGNALSSLGAFADGAVHYAEALRVREEIGHLHGIAVTLDQWAVNHAMSGDLESAKALHERAIEKRREQGSPSGLAMALNNYSMTLVSLKEFDAALTANDEAYAVVTEAGMADLAASTLDTRGLLHLERGHLTEAVATFRRVLALPGDQLSVAIKTVTLENLADAHARAGRAEDAVAALKEALLLREDMGNEKAAEKLRARIAELS